MPLPKKRTNAAKPLISIITVVRNGKDTLEQCINSVVDQTYKHIEYIVIDAASTDGTVDILERYKDKIDYWVSEPDGGIYDAMNKGISIARGQWIYFLGCDDELMNRSVIESVFEENKEDLASTDVIFGNVLLDKVLQKSRYGPWLKIKNTIHHQSAFYNKRLFDSFRYNSGFSVSSDYELNLRLFLGKAKAVSVGWTIARCGGKGVSTAGKWNGYDEEIKIRRSYLQWYEIPILNMLTGFRFILKNFLVRFAKSK